MKTLADPFKYRNYVIRRIISPVTKKSLYIAIPASAKYFVTPIDELELLKELVDEELAASRLSPR